MYLSHNAYVKFSHGGKQYAVLIQQEECPMNPRTDWDDNLDFMVCFHGRYRLGDRLDYKDPEEFWRELVRNNVPMEAITKAACNGDLYGIRVAPNPDDENRVDVYEYYALRTIIGQSEASEVLEYEGILRETVGEYILDDLEIEHCQHLLEGVLVWLPLYLYDHSGLTMSTGSFGDPWDSGQVGWIYMTKEIFLAETGWGEELWPSRAIEMMQNSVETYDQYLTGEVYGFAVYENTGTDADPSWEETDNSCWGFYGDDPQQNGLAEYIPGLPEALASGDYETGTAFEHRVTTITYDFG